MRAPRGLRKCASCLGPLRNADDFGLPAQGPVPDPFRYQFCHHSVQCNRCATQCTRASSQYQTHLRRVLAHRAVLTASCCAGVPTGALKLDRPTLAAVYSCQITNCARPRPAARSCLSCWRHIPPGVLTLERPRRERPYYCGTEPGPCVRPRRPCCCLPGWVAWLPRRPAPCASRGCCLQHTLWPCWLRLLSVLQGLRQTLTVSGSPRRLPPRPITVVVRTDASGTTQQVTEYLAADANAWTLGSGKTIGWPKCVVTVQGSEGVVSYVAANTLSIGCVLPDL